MSTRKAPRRAFPSYAYLPGHYPHPVRDSGGHSFDVEAEGHVGELQWGAILFDAGYYWEAHEAWEPFWRGAKSGSAERALLKSLILLAATGVKLREGKIVAARRHASRAIDGLRAVNSDATSFGEAGRILSNCIRDVPWSVLPAHRATVPKPTPVFGFSIAAVVDTFSL